MIYAPLYLIRRIGAEGEVDRTLASSPKVTPIAHKTANTRKQATVAHYYYGATQQQGRQHTTRQHGTELSSRTVTSSLSGALVTHDEYRTFKLVRVV